MLNVTEHIEGCVLPIRAVPGARRATILGTHAGALKVAVTAQAEKGKANDALLHLLRKQLGMKRSELELIAGETSREKRILVRGKTSDELRRMLAKWLEA
jgi:uncharacterized protein (TIGR00251 family)